MRRSISLILVILIIAGLITGCAKPNEWLYFWDPTESAIANTYKIQTDNSGKTLFVNGGQDLQIVGEWAYYLNYADGRRIYRIKLDGTENSAITEQNERQINAQFYVLDDWIYYSSCQQFLSEPGADEKYYSDTGAQLFRIKKDGTSSEMICDSKISFFTIDADWINFTTAYTDEYKLYKIKSDGSDLTRIGDVTCLYMKVIAGWIYYIDSSMQRLCRISTDGTDNRVIVEDRVNETLFNHFYYSAGRLYYSTSSGIFKIRSDGSDKTQITDVGGSYIFVEGNNLYYVHSDSGWWGKTYTYRISIDGKGKKKLCEGFRIYFNPILSFDDSSVNPTETSTDTSPTLHLVVENSLQNVIACGPYHTIALKKDGTAVAAGNGSPKDFYIPMCEVDSWDSLIAVSAGMLHSAGLKSDGTVVATGMDKEGQCSGTTGWTGIVAIAAGPECTVGLCQNDSVVFAGILDAAKQTELSKWREVVDIAVGGCIVGLKSDGTVVAVGDNWYGECSVSTWQNIVAIAAGERHTVGLRKDGTVVATGLNDTGACDTDQWRDIVAVTAGQDFTVGLKKNGELVFAGKEFNVSAWSNTVAIAAGRSHLVGLKSDGTVVAAGDNGEQQCDVAGWGNIGLP